MVSTLRTLVPYLIRYRWRFAAGILALVLKSLTAVAIPLVIRYAIDYLSQRLTLALVLELAGALLLIAGVKAVFQFWMRWLLIGVSRDVEYDMRGDLLGHLLTLSPRFYQTYRTGDLMSRLTDDLSAVRNMVGPGVMFTAELTTTFLAALAVMSATDWRLTLLIFIPVPLVSFTVTFFGQRVHRRFRRVQERLADISSMAQESLSNIRVVRAYAQGRGEVERFQRLNDDYIGENVKLIRLWGRFYPTLELLIGLTYLAVLGFGGWQTLQGRITVGSFVMFMTYLALLTWPMIGFGWVINTVQQGMASLERLNELLQQRPEIADGPHTDASITAIRGDVTFQDVSFQYPGASRPALQGVSFYVPAGQALAIVGPIGSGKTTLVSLIPRLMEIKHGRILVDAAELAAIPLAVLRGAIGYVTQESFLFSKTIRENITFGAPQASDEEIAEALETAQLRDDLADFPDGLETMAGERGVTLSGGQKQRVSIARALLRNPRILILDDALSSVDAETEERILTRLRLVMRNRTTLMISHRVSTARHADQILVLVAGEIREAGTHDELLAARGHYYELHQQQLLEQELELV